MNAALFSSESAEWATPQWLFDALHSRFGFTLDVCASQDNAKLPRYFTLACDGLRQSWQGERCWMNPPYGRAISLWVPKARQASEAGTLVVGLLPARTDTRWWQKNVNGHAYVHFISGRLKFGGAKNSAPFPSAIVIWTGINFLHEAKDS